MRIQVNGLQRCLNFVLKYLEKFPALKFQNVDFFRKMSVPSLLIFMTLAESVKPESGFQVILRSLAEKVKSVTSNVILF